MSVDSSNDELTRRMEIEIKFGRGKSDLLVVHYGDDPNVLAEKFVDRHKLRKNSASIISQYIQSTIEEFDKKTAEDTEMRPQSPSLGSVHTAHTLKSLVFNALSTLLINNSGK